MVINILLPYIVLCIATVIAVIFYSLIKRRIPVFFRRTSTYVGILCLSLAVALCDSLYGPTSVHQAEMAKQAACLKYPQVPQLLPQFSCEQIINLSDAAKLIKSRHPLTYRDYPVLSQDTLAIRGLSYLIEEQKKHFYPTSAVRQEEIIREARNLLNIADL